MCLCLLVCVPACVCVCLFFYNFPWIRVVSVDFLLVLFLFFFFFLFFLFYSSLLITLVRWIPDGHTTYDGSGIMISFNYISFWGLGCFSIERFWDASVWNKFVSCYIWWMGVEGVVYWNSWSRSAVALGVVSSVARFQLYIQFIRSGWRGVFVGVLFWLIFAY